MNYITVVMSRAPTITAERIRSRVQPYAALIRAPFLVFTIVVISLPAAVAVTEGIFNPVYTLYAFGSVLFGHIAVNILNVASDYRTGIDDATDTTAYSGGSDVLTTGMLTYRRALVVGALSIVLSAGFVVPLVIAFGVPVIGLYAIGIVLVVGYTDVFARSGLGELACGVGLTALPTIAVGYIQAGTIPTAVWALSVPMFIVGFNLLLLNEIPDITPDRANGRVNIPIVFGRRVAGYLYVLLVGVLVVSLLVSVTAGLLPWTILLGIVPVALLRPIGHTVWEEETLTIGESELSNHILWTQTTIVALTVGMLLSIPL